MPRTDVAMLTFVPREQSQSREKGGFVRDIEEEYEDAQVRSFSGQCW